MGRQVAPKSFTPPGALGSAPGMNVITGGPATEGSAAASSLIPNPPPAPATPAAAPKPTVTPTPVQRPNPAAMFGNYPDYWRKIAFGKNYML